MHCKEQGKGVQQFPSENSPAINYFLKKVNDLWQAKR
jgi:hypothetical protein